MKIDLDTPAFNILIIAFLMVIIFAGIGSMQGLCGGSSNYAEPEVTKIQLNSFSNICKTYFKITGRAPSKLEDLVTYPGNVKKWRQFLEEIPKDPWNNDYIYTLQDDIATVSSTGPTDSLDDDIKLSFDFSVLENKDTD